MSDNVQAPVEIWHIEPVQEHRTLEQLESVLPPQKQQRAQRIQSDPDRATYICSHAAMRLIIADHLQQPVDQVSFLYSAHGKPYLDPVQQLFFNLSHTRGYALLALSPQYEVGIDIEIIRPARKVLAIAKRFFTADEFNWLERADPAHRNALFYQLWCHKEACLKASGQGLQGGLASFSLTEQDLQQEILIKDGQQQKWWVQSVAVPASYRAAIAMDCPGIEPVKRYWEYQPG